MIRRINLIGHGYECVKFYMIDTKSMPEGMAIAEQRAKEEGIDYIEIEIPHEYAYNE